jgi:hypothetical protein
MSGEYFRKLRRLGPERDAAKHGKTTGEHHDDH